MAEKTNQQSETVSTPTHQSASAIKSFPRQFWLVIMFEFFERGSYYGMMSVLAVYLTDILRFPKEGVGIIAGTIQPILYFLPIISGALADRFGYRRMLTIAFTFLGGGYFLTSQMTDYTAVFLSLCVMALGAGTFKPIISGSIARMTNENNSTLGFGIFYWTINLGAFLFPLILVPFLKNNIGWHWVIVASAVGTGAMLIPTLFLFKEPPRTEKKAEKEFNLIQTVANAFEIIYSPFILIFHHLRGTKNRRLLISALILILLLAAIWNYLAIKPVEEKIVAHIIKHDQTNLIINIERDVTRKMNYQLKNQIVTPVQSYNLIIETQNRNGRFEFFKPIDKDGPDLMLVLYSTNLDSIYNLLSTELNQYVSISKGRLDSTLDRLSNKQNNRIYLTIYKPENFNSYKLELLQSLQTYPELADLTMEELIAWLEAAEIPTTLLVKMNSGSASEEEYEINAESDNKVVLVLNKPEQYEQFKANLLTDLRSYQALSHLSQSRLDQLVENTNQRSFLFLFIMLLFLSALAILTIQLQITQRLKLVSVLGLCSIVVILIWLLPGIGNYGRIISTVIYLTVLSLFLIDFQNVPKYQDHFHFLLMIFIYSGFWILYFQMFGSVLWYVKAYVDASSLNTFINNFLGYFNIHINWFFDVEHVTVINAGTIILLQLLVSTIVKHTKALPTMIAGILMGTIGMAILAISTGIWIFLIGIIIFSIGEMTAHPKFISYVGQTAPKDRVATYMGYIFLYGVIGSSIGSVLGANLYVEFVDKLHQPRVLWLIFSGIGVTTIACLLLYNKFLAKEEPAQKNKSQN